MDYKLKVLELFAGARCIGKAAEKLGCEVFSVDWENYPGINLSIDIQELKKEQIPFIPDFIWLSPDCATYSIAGIRFHRRNTIQPISEYALKCDAVNIYALQLVNEFLKINPNIIFCIENPRGMLRKMPFMRGLARQTVWYCQYGDNRAKPTDIWSNNFYSLFNPLGWMPRPECHNNNNNCHHEKAPRGSMAGTSGLKNAHERSKIPQELCIEILKNAIEKNGLIPQTK